MERDHARPLDPNVPESWYEEPGFLAARQVYSEDQLEDLIRHHESRGLKAKGRTVQLESGEKLVYLVLFVSTDEGMVP